MRFSDRSRSHPESVNQDSDLCCGHRVLVRAHRWWHTLIVNCLEVVVPLWSVRVTVKVSLVAEAPTGPEITPVEALSMRPWGKTPDVIDQV